MSQTRDMPEELEMQVCFKSTTDMQNVIHRRPALAATYNSLNRTLGTAALWRNCMGL